jgi:putative selenium metabolism hydrolase
LIDREGCIWFLRQLIRTPSLPGDEEAIAKLVVKQMQVLGFDEAFQDNAGNVIGIYRGRGNGPSVMLNSHLDHVDVGDEARWKYPPFGSEVHDGRVWGRGAVDIKGPLAAQVYGVAGLIADGERPDGDTYVTAVVQEEIGGVGACVLVDSFEPGLVVVGEPSSNRVMRGHRGRTELVVRAFGRSAHASAPDRGLNPLPTIAKFILGLYDLTMTPDRDLGRSTVAPTLIRTDQTSPNVIPSEVQLVCDWRNVPGEGAQTIRTVAEQLARECADEGIRVQVEVPTSERTTYTGFRIPIASAHPAFILPSGHPTVEAASRIASELTGKEESSGVWGFATDGGHFAQAGWTVIGFGPGEEGLAHTVTESIEIAQLVEAAEVYRAFALNLGVEGGK